MEPLPYKKAQKHSMFSKTTKLDNYRYAVKS